MVTSLQAAAQMPASLGLEELMRQAMTGDARSYEQFLTSTATYLRRMVARKIPKADVEDVVQEILISIHKARHTYDGKRAILPWISAIARYRMVDYLRKYYADHAAQRVDLETVEHFLEQPVTESAEHSELLSTGLSQLPERQQRILTLMHVEGYTAKEVGTQLGMKESAVKVAAHRAYKLIRTRLVS